MNQTKFICKTITPMFIAGADARTPELRPSEFKGMMRFWWRAIKAEDDIKKLKKEEAGIFGGSGEGEGKSKVTIKIKYDKDNLKRFIGKNLKKDYGLEWEFDRGKNSLKGRDNGIAYLLYSTILPGRERRFIKDGLDFSLEISSYEKNSFEKALASLWLAIYLGGFGTRARRGGGNIYVEKIEGFQIDLDFTISSENSSEIAQWLIKNFEKISNIINGSPAINNFCTSYSNLSLARFIISDQGYNKWQDALNDVGKMFSEFRSKHRKELFDSAVFGLPVVHRNNTKVFGKDREYFFQRRSSPLIFKCIKSGNKFYWLVIRMSGEFLPEGGTLKSQNQSQKPDYRLIDEFWNEIKNKGKEYILSRPEILNKMIEDIKNKLNPRKIILYGSRARGDAHKKADIDIAVETDIISSFDNINNVDIVNLKKIDDKLKQKIEKEGITVYERKI